jgi:hypothetical protein
MSRHVQVLQALLKQKLRTLPAKGIKENRVSQELCFLFRRLAQRGSLVA